MKNLNPYLNFAGNAREAMNFYKDCLGGTLEIMEVGGSPIEDHMPNTPKTDVVHSSLTSGEFILMGSDMIGKDDLIVGNNTSIMVDCSSLDEINSLYSKLSAGGNPDHPVSPAFWGGHFGHLVDKFGIHWALNCSP